MNLSRLTHSAAITLLIICFLTSCRKKEDDPTPPAIPAVTTFQMDFREFVQATDTVGHKNGGPYKNWGYANLTVTSWQTLIAGELALPVVAYRGALKQVAVYNRAAGNWTWSCSVTHNSTAYNAELTGYVQADTVVWEMRISGESRLSGDLCFYGKSALNQKGGYWIVPEDPIRPGTLLRIDWNRYAANLTEIRYTNISPTGPGSGSYLDFGISTDILDRFCNVYNAELINLTEIEWSHYNNYGRIRDTLNFGNTVWHCWDFRLNDGDCEWI